MIKDYEEFKKFVLDLTTIDLNAYKERQMKRKHRRLRKRMLEVFFTSRDMRCYIWDVIMEEHMSSVHWEVL